MNSLTPPSSAAVIGAGGGIGAAILRQLNRSPQFDKVFAFSRRGGDSTGRLDITDEDSIKAAVEGIDVPLDLVIVATGVLYTDRFMPEKSLRHLDADAMLEVLAVNTVGPTLVAKHLLPKMRRDGRTVFAALSARVGSIGDNRLGGWLSYRSSKAALNMALKTIAIEHGRNRPDAVVVGLHPGTVDTDLSSPFQRGVPKDKLFTPDYAAGQLLAVIDDLTPSDTGKVFAWDGSGIEP